MSFRHLHQKNFSRSKKKTDSYVELDTWKNTRMNMKWTTGIIYLNNLNYDIILNFRKIFENFLKNFQLGQFEETIISKMTIFNERISKNYQSKTHFWAL